VNKKHSILLLIVTLFLISCASSNSSMPSWFVNQYDSTYNNNLYLVAVGAGDSLEEAEENAKISLSQTFNTSIKNAMQTFENDTTSSFSSRGFVETSIDDLVGVKVVNTYKSEEGIYYVRVALDKRLSIDKTREIITPNNNEINVLMMRGNKNNFQYLQDLLRAQKIAITIQKYFDQLSVLENTIVSSPLMNIENKIADIKSNLSIQIEVESPNIDSSNQLKNVIETNLIDSGISIEESSAMLIVDYNEGSVTKHDDLYHVGFNIQVQLIDNDFVVFSINKESRGIGISEETARNKALEKAVKIIEGELF